MSRYIDADKIEYAPCTVYQYNGKDVTEMIAYKKLIDIMPTADVEKVRHGKWIYEGTYVDAPYRCSECRRLSTNEYPYCHCGAKMDGDAK